ncbi:MAG: molybdopterin-dependent oxidoreductase [Thermomicrobiales bacterium]
MSWQRRVATLFTGGIAGLLAASCMLLVMVAGRTWLGISPLPESVPDRIAPTLSIREFFDLFGRYGGYNGLKKFGVTTGIQAVVGVGTLTGLLYPLLAESRWARRRGAWRLGISRVGVAAIALVLLVVWGATLVAMRPVLQTNYRGLPPTEARIVTSVGLLLTYLVFAVVLVVGYHWIAWRDVSALRSSPQPDGEAPDDRVIQTREPGPVGAPRTRRAVLAVGAGGAAAWATYALVKRLYDRAVFTYDGQVYNGPGVQPVVPNEKFYTVTKNVVDPNVSTDVWGLEIGGLVDRSYTYDFAEISSLPSVEQESTLMCISNRIGAGLASNAVWTGVRLADMLGVAGVGAGAVEVKLYGTDGYTDTFAIEKALDPATLVAYRMNGEPLPERHGYPVRVIVPGLYGEKNVKWVTGIEVIDHDGKGFYEGQGWGPNFVIPTRSDFFAPAWKRTQKGDFFTGTFTRAQTVQLRGRAFAGDRGAAGSRSASMGRRPGMPRRSTIPAHD